MLSIVPLGKPDQASKPAEQQEGRSTLPVTAYSMGDQIHRSTRSAALRCWSRLLADAWRSRGSRRSTAPKMPAPGPAPQLRVPTWTKTTLANGADLVVVEKHDLPLVSFTINFVGGANQFEPADKTRPRGLTAAMLSEGTTTQDGEALSKALQLLGTTRADRHRRRKRLDRLHRRSAQVRGGAGPRSPTCC